jgi:hypothetical protein
VCASERYAFLSAWLPSEERRRWRRPAPESRRAEHGPIAAFKRLLARWFDDPDLDPTPVKIRTRASDHVPDLSFGERDRKAPEPRTHTHEPIKEDR